MIFRLIVICCALFAMSCVIVTSDDPYDICDDNTCYVQVAWNINGTVDGTTLGKSWDTCSEVGATHALVSIDGQQFFKDCSAGGNMSAKIEVIKSPLSVKIQLINGTPTTYKTLTTWTPSAKPDIVAGSFTDWTYVGEFYYDSFTGDKNGDYWFSVAYGGKSCLDYSPPVTHNVALLKLDGKPVNPAPKMCGPDSNCVDANGAAFGDCYDKDQTQKLKTVKWGEYKLTLQGTLDTSLAYEVCWESNPPIDILIGAGDTNPLKAHDLPKVTTGQNCP